MPTDHQLIADLIRSELPTRWVFTGDSITHGALHTLGFRDYPELISERLRYEMRRGRDMVLKTGISGWTISQILGDIEWNILQFRPNLLSINVGMNDCVRIAGGVAEFKRDYHAVIDKARKTCGCAVVLHTPNAIGSWDPARFAALPAYAQAVREVAAESGAVLVDHFEIWKKADAAARMYLWLSDAIHPNNFGHVAMAHETLRVLGMWDPGSFVCRLYVP